MPARDSLRGVAPRSDLDLGMCSLKEVFFSLFHFLF